MIVSLIFSTVASSAYLDDIALLLQRKPYSMIVSADGKLSETAIGKEDEEFFHFDGCLADLDRKGFPLLSFRVVKGEPKADFVNANQLLREISQSGEFVNNVNVSEQNIVIISNGERRVMHIKENDGEYETIMLDKVLSDAFDLMKYPLLVRVSQSGKIIALCYKTKDGVSTIKQFSGDRFGHLVEFKPALLLGFYGEEMVMSTGDKLKIGSQDFSYIGVDWFSSLRGTGFFQLDANGKWKIFKVTKSGSEYQFSLLNLPSSVTGRKVQGHAIDASIK